MCICNHFYVIGAKSYRIRRNNANYTAITPFSIIQGHRFGTNRKLVVISTNFPSILHRFQVMGPIIRQIFAVDMGVPHFNAAARVISCECLDKLEGLSY